MGLKSKIFLNGEGCAAIQVCIRRIQENQRYSKLWAPGASALQRQQLLLFLRLPARKA